jgi:apolipoprotein D and lipocalin family protein
VSASLRHIIAALIGASLAACSGYPPMPVVEHVDLSRFMGDWYVIANIPTFIERGAHNAVESYRLEADGTIATTFTFRDGGFDGERKVYRPRGYVLDTDNNALWGMQFVWPIKADYRIVYLDDDYRVTVIARKQRDYVWLMAREPELDPRQFEELQSFIAELGYDTSQLQRVPQQW